MPAWAVALAANRNPKDPPPCGLLWPPATRAAPVKMRLDRDDDLSPASGTRLPTTTRRL